MANILLTGIATLDIINHVDNYPTENDEIRASKQTLKRGGNAANSAEVLAQLGHNASLNCTLAHDESGQFILKDLARKGIQVLADTPSNAHFTPTSYITLNTANGSRSIIHHRDLPELCLQHFDQIKLDAFNWFHFEARNIAQTFLMMSKAAHCNKTISLEVEKARLDGDIHDLLPLADVIMLSKPFALSQGFISAADSLESFSTQFPDKIFSCTWGSEGAWIIKNTVLHHSPACAPKKIIDTIGAGDTFNAALIDALINKHSIDKSVYIANKLAGLKCSQFGFENLVKQYY